MYCTKKPFYAKGGVEDLSIMDAYIMHIVSLQIFFVLICIYYIILIDIISLQLNHVLRTRNLVIKNEAKLFKHKNSGNEEILHEDAFRDQGYTRPKVNQLLQMDSNLCILSQFVTWLVVDEIWS